MELLPFEPVKGDAEYRKKNIARYIEEINDYLDRKQKNIDITDMAAQLAEIFRKKIGIDELYQKGRSKGSENNSYKEKYNFCKFKTTTKFVPYVTNLFDDDTGELIEYSFKVTQTTVRTPWGACVIGRVEDLYNPIWEIINQFVAYMMPDYEARINRLDVSAEKKRRLIEALYADFVDDDDNPIDMDDVDIKWALKNIFHLVTENDIDFYNDWEASFMTPYTPRNGMFQEWWMLRCALSEAFPTFWSLLDTEMQELYAGYPLRTIFQIPLDATIKPLAGDRVYDYTVMNENTMLEPGPLREMEHSDWRWGCGRLTIPVEGINENMFIYLDEEDTIGELNYEYLKRIEYVRIDDIDFKIKKATPPDVIADMTKHEWTEDDESIVEVFDEETGERTAVVLYLDISIRDDIGLYYKDSEIPAQILHKEAWGYIQYPEPPAPTVILGTYKGNDVSLPSRRGLYSEYSDWYERVQYFSDEGNADIYHEPDDKDIKNFEVHFLPLIDLEVTYDEEDPEAEPVVHITKKDPTTLFNFMIMGGEVTDVECDEVDEHFYWDYFEGELDEFLSFWGDKIYPPAIADIENDGFYYPTDDNPVDKTPMEYFYEAAPDRNIAQITAYFQTNGMTFDWFATAAYYYVWSGGHYDPEDNEEFHYSATVLANIKNMILQAYNKNNELYNIFGNLTDD